MSDRITTDDSGSPRPNREEEELEEMVVIARADRALCQEAYRHAEPRAPRSVVDDRTADDRTADDRTVDDRLDDTRLRLVQALAIEIGYRRLLEIHRAGKKKAVDGAD